MEIVSKEFISNSRKATIEFAKDLAFGFIGGEVLALSGELGAGKTVFAKGIAEGLDIPDTVSSPTFTIIRQYDGRLKLNHLDLYRISEEELPELGIDDIFSPQAVCVIEWAENAPGILPANYITVQIERLAENMRKITVGERKK